MTMISKYPLTEDVKKRVTDIFYQSLADLKEPNQVANFLKEFLTPTEQVMLAKRISIGYLLGKKYEARTISNILKVSVTTVTSVNRLIKHNKGYFYSMIEKLLKEEKNQKFWDELEYNIEKTTIPFTVGNWSNKRKNIEKEHNSKTKPF